MLHIRPRLFSIRLWKTDRIVTAPGLRRVMARALKTLARSGYMMRHLAF